jgi:hypothetical protein
MNLKNTFLIVGILFLSACASAIPKDSLLGYSESRRLVIVGENVDLAIAQYYQREYNCQVWFTPFQGKVSNAANNFMESGFGPSHAMRALIGELKSINYTVGRWEIIVPKIAEKYFLKTLKHMPASSVAKARGMVVLLDSSGFPEMERQLQRVTNGNFFVNYEFRKDVSPQINTRLEGLEPPTPSSED